MPGTLASVRKAPSNRTIGMEIELFMKKEPPYGFKGFWYYGDDGSIRRPSWDWYGCELVTQPLTLPWMRRELVKKHKEIMAFNADTNDSCGIHVHVNRNWMTLERAKAVHNFLLQQSDVTLGEWFGRRPNRFCKRGTDRSDRYNIINFTNKHTIEIRLFASYLNVRWWLWCADFTEYLTVNAKHLNFDAIEAFRCVWDRTQGE